MDLTLAAAGRTAARTRVRIRPPGCAHRARAGDAADAVSGRARYRGGKDSSRRFSTIPISARSAGRRLASTGRSSRGDVRFFIAGRTGMMVKRAAVGAEGFVLDHYDRAAIDHHLKLVGDPLMKAFGRPPAVCGVQRQPGSLRVRTGRPIFSNEFRKRRGYDLTPYLPALAAGAGSQPARFATIGARRSPNWPTNASEPVQDWAPQATAPASVADLRHAAGDAVEQRAGRSAGRRRRPSGIAFITRWASSASHLYDKPVTSSETWTWLHSPVFRATPLDMKAEADLHFLQGINQLIGHGWPYSAEASTIRAGVSTRRRCSTTRTRGGS